MSKHQHQERVDLFVQGCLAQMDVGREWFATRVLPLRLDQLRWRSGIGAWSILDCLNHIHHMFEHYLPKLEQAIRISPRPLVRFPSDLLLPESETEFLKQSEPLIGTASTMPPLLVRFPAASPDWIVDQYPQLRARYSAAVRAASELDLANTIVAGSIHPPIRSMGGTIALLAAYDRRYMWQSEQVMKALGLPAPVGLSSHVH